MCTILRWLLPFHSGGQGLDRIISDGDDKVGGSEQQISRLVRELANPSAKIIKQGRAHGACCLERADDR